MKYHLPKTSGRPANSKDSRGSMARRAFAVPIFILALIVAFSAAFRLANAAEADAIDRKAIENIVREYLLANPEIIQDALAELEKRAEKERNDTRAATLQTAKDELLRSPDDVVLGNPDGSVTLVEFFDFNCGYCKRALPDVEKLVAADPGLRVVLKDFPILGPGSVEAAKVALALNAQSDQSQRAEFHTRLLETQGQINGSRAMTIAQEMGFDIDKLEMGLKDPLVQAAIDRNLALAQKLGLTGTPSFIIGSNIIEGAVGVSALQDAIKTARDCDGAVSC